MPEPPDLSALVGCTLGRLCLDYQVTLSLASSGNGYGQRVDALLVVEAPFTVTHAGERRQVVPGESQGMEATVVLLHRKVANASLGADESLSLVLEGDVEVHVSRDPAYESWQISGRGVPAWIAGPA